jgi:hypothetical protein
MELDRDKLDRFVDGELPPEEMEAIAVLLAGSPEQDAHVARQERLRNQLRDGFRALDASMPRRLIETVRTTPISWRWRLRAALEPDQLFRWLVPASAALVLGFVAGTSLTPRSDLGTSASGQVIAQGDLDKALDRQLASQADSGPIRIGISFRNKTGQVCRTFNSGDNAGLACHKAGAWVIGMLVRQVPEDAGAAYHMAGSEMPDAVRHAVTASMRGEPFDAATEARAAKAGWPEIKASGH